MPAPKLEPQNRLSPLERAQRALSAEFLKHLGDKFGFDGADRKIAESVRDIAQAYFVVLGRRKLNFRKEARREYLQLIRDTAKFLEILENAKALGLADDMEIIARMRAHISSPAKSHPITNDRNSAGKFDQLIALLNLLGLTAEHGKEIYSSKPGPKVDKALETLVRRAMDYWIFNLGRKFTIDHHKGTGTTKSFEFVRTLASQLGDISDTEIVTAIRADKSVRRKFEMLAEKSLRRAK